MGTERKNGEVDSAVFTPTQEHVARSVLATLRNPKSPKTLVVVEGLSGVGKSLITDSIHDGILLNGGHIVPSDDIRYYSSRLERSGHIVTTAVPGELKQIKEVISEKLPEYRLVTHTLRGMTQQEIGEYMARFSSQKENSLLTPEEIASYSLGVPLLAKRMLSSFVTKNIAISMAAQYLAENFGKEIISDREVKEAQRKYLAMPVPQEISDGIHNLNRDGWKRMFYKKLNHALDTQDKLSKRGVEEESPLFVAPESDQIYNEMIVRFAEKANIDIFVPSLELEDFGRIQRAFGFVGWQGYKEFESTRARMFGAHYRKIEFWHRDSSGEEFISDERNDAYESKRKLKIAHGYVEAYEKGEFGLEPHGKKGEISFLIHAHDHERMVSNPVAIGWMSESLLQQRGIAYFVNNDMHGSSYFYNPNTRHIEFVAERPKVKSM